MEFWNSESSSRRRILWRIEWWYARPILISLWPTYLVPLYFHFKFSNLNYHVTLRRWTLIFRLLWVILWGLSEKKVENFFWIFYKISDLSRFPANLRFKHFPVDSQPIVKLSFLFASWTSSFGTHISAPELIMIPVLLQISVTLSIRPTNDRSVWIKFNHKTSSRTAAWLYSKTD